MNDETVPTTTGSGVHAAQETIVGEVVTRRHLEPVPDLQAADAAQEARDQHPAGTGGMVPLEVVDALRNEFQAAVADIEFRLGQQYELMRRQESPGELGRVYAEDIVEQRHRLTGYQMLNNSNGTSTVTGSIAWKQLHVVLLGVDYTITDGSTSSRYAWFIKPASGTSATLQTGNTVPALGPNDALIFVNDNGTAVSALESAITYAVGPGTVTETALAQDVQQMFANIDLDIAAVQASADGAVTSYYQNDPPWPAGAPAPGENNGAAKTGDIWYDANDGGAFRWTGPTGTPVNSWQRIADTDTSEIAAKVNTKVTTYVNSVAPTAPTGGFTTGDLWIDTANGNVVKRWSGSGWTTLSVGDAAISGVGATKISGVIAAGSIPTLDISTKTTGTLTGTRIGSGINGGNVNSGTIGNTQLSSSAVTPSKIVASIHMLY